MKAVEKLDEAIRGFWGIHPYQDIVSWCQEHVDFSDDIGAELKRLNFDMHPYQVEPLRAWEHDNMSRTVQVIGIEQHGKTNLEVLGTLFSLFYYPGNFLIVYPSDDLAEDINRSKYEPLIHKIPELAAELEKPRSKRADRYILGNSTIVFQGSGRKVVSRSCSTVIADELSAWTPPPGVDSFEDLKKRTRTYRQSICYSVTTPSEDTNKSWKNFLEGSRGYWSLRCKRCNQLTIRSCDLYHLQFESTYDEKEDLYFPIEDSIRLVCPLCKHEHIETEKRWMNLNGAYVHEYPDRIRHYPTFQFGALCSQLPSFSWLSVATKILRSGKSADYVEQRDYDNSWRGLPFKARRIDGEKVDKIKAHMFDHAVDTATIECLFVVSDTQDTFSPTGMFAVDTSNNIVMLKYAELEHLFLDDADRDRVNAQRKEDGLPPVETVEDWLNCEYLGMRPAMSVVDKKGHRTTDVEEFCKRNLRKCVMYAGSGPSVETYRKADKPYTYQVNARFFQSELLYSLYGQAEDADANGFRIYSGIEDRFLQEIAAVGPDQAKRSGHSYANWGPLKSQKHDCFDVCKMAFFGRRFLFEKFDMSVFRQRRNKALLKAKNVKVDESHSVRQDNEEAAPAQPEMTSRQKRRTYVTKGWFKR